MEAALAAEEQKLFEAKLAQSLNVSVQGGRIDPATAQAQYRAAVAERQNQQMAKSLAEYDVSQRIAAAKERYPEMDEEMVRSIGLAYHGRADFDIHEIARRSHERNISYLERHLASYEAHRAEERAAPLSAENGRMAIAGNSKGVLRRSWEELLGLTKTSI